MLDDDTVLASDLGPGLMAEHQQGPCPCTAMRAMCSSCTSAGGQQAAAALLYGHCGMCCSS
jgi:hypothetical protein